MLEEQDLVWLIYNSLDYKKIIQNESSFQSVSGKQNIFVTLIY